MDTAREQEFDRSCIPEVGRLLHVLAGSRGRERVAEIGTGCGVGTAWMVSALPSGVTVYTAEVDEKRAAAAAGVFGGDPDVHVLTGDWRKRLPPEAPFDLIFFDAAKQQHPQEDGELVAGMLTPGGIAILDDLTPGLAGPDPLREFWLGHDELAAAEVLTTPTTSAILAVRQ